MIQVFLFVFGFQTEGEKQALLGAVPPPITDRSLFEEVEFERAPTSVSQLKVAHLCCENC